MTDESPAAAPQDSAVGPRFEIRHQYIRDLSFEVPDAPKVFENLAAAPEVAVNVAVSPRQLGEQDHEVVLKIEARGSFGGSPMFIAELEYAGLIRLHNIPAEHVEPMLHIEAARLLFPFARNVVAAVTRDGGLPQLMITPIDFAALYQRRLARKSAAQPPAEQKSDA